VPTEKRSMKRLLFTTLLCALGTAHVSAENEVSQQLFDWKEDQRNAAFTDMLWDSNLKCESYAGIWVTTFD
jgi:predicted mannosyl-3-phosphoglycerate phosphatase (HAD superfamily)